MSYYGVGFCHQNVIFELRIKELALVSWTLLPHSIILWPEAVSVMMWDFSFNTSQQRYNSLEMDKDGKIPEQNFAGV